jgi:hypothetical protein
LAKARRCAWLKDTVEGPVRPVFIRRQTIAFHCPKSIITARSLNFIEQFAAWRRHGGDLWSLDAKSADAICVLEEESLKETNNEED